MPLDALPRELADCRPLRFLVQHPADRLRKLFRLSGRHEFSGHAAFDDLRVSANFRCDDGEAHRHRFQKSQRDSFCPRGRNKEGRLSEFLRDVTALAEKLDMRFQTKVPRELLKMRSLAAVSHDLQSEIRVLLNDNSNGSNQRRKVLLRREPRHADCYWGAGGTSKFEAVQVDAVPDGNRLPARTTIVPAAEPGCVLRNTDDTIRQAVGQAELQPGFPAVPATSAVLGVDDD